jgi:hypothetical protein
LLLSNVLRNTLRGITNPPIVRPHDIAPFFFSRFLICPPHRPPPWFRYI